MTPGEKRAYQRGVNRATARNHDRMQKLIRIARQYRERESSDEECICQTCDRWRQGTNNTVWGFCRADFQYGVEPRMWADSKSGDADLITDATFGCISWIPAPEQREG